MLTPLIAENNNHRLTAGNECVSIINITSISKSLGFTLIELMIVVAIIGILTAVALPSYQDYITRAKVADATSELSSRRVQMEQYYQDNHTYVNTLQAGCATATASRYFTFACSPVATATNFTIVASGTGSMAGFTYTINELNVKNSSIVSPAPVSWRAVNGACWITKAGGIC